MAATHPATAGPTGHAARQRVAAVRRPARRRPEQPRIQFRRRPRPLPIPRPQPPRYLALAAPGERHQTFRVRGQQVVAKARHRLGSGHVRPAHETAEAAVTRRVAGQQDEVRAALPLADSTQVLANGVAIAGQAGTFRARPDRQTLFAPRVILLTRCRRRRRAATPRRPATPRAPRPPRRDHDPRRIRHGRVRQLYLDPDDRPQPRLLRLGRESNHAVEPVMVRDRQPGQAQFNGTRDQFVGRRSAVEEREIGVAMEFGVLGHSRCPVTGASHQYRTPVLSTQARAPTIESGLRAAAAIQLLS